MRRRYRLLLALLVVVGVPFYWLLLDNNELAIPTRRLDLAAMRRLAEAVPGARPDKVVVQDVASRWAPGTLLVAGGGLELVTVTVCSFLLIRPGPDIVIDSGLSAADARGFGFTRYRRAAQQEVERELRRAGLILFTHEHLDHLGGLLRLPDAAEIAQRALITPAQVAGKLPWPAGMKAAIRPFRYRGMAAVAPGVVLIETPGHTPGSQMIYVRLTTGREYLFAGDTATMGRSWRWARGRSRFLSDLIAREDRAAVLAWLAAIRELKRRAPGLVVVPGHDLNDMLDPRLRSGIYHGFIRMTPLPPPPPPLH